MIIAAIVLTSLLGPRIDGKENCYAVNDRYAACLQYAFDGTLERIDVRPGVRLAGPDAEFDRRRDSLCPAEYKEILSRLKKLRDFGRDFTPPFRVGTVTNFHYDLWETWEHAIIQTWYNDYLDDTDNTIISFNVRFYEPVRGRIDRTVEPECADDYCWPDDNDFLAGVRPFCPGTGPTRVTIDGRDYDVAPMDQDRFRSGELVTIHGARIRDREAED